MDGSVRTSSGRRQGRSELCDILPDRADYMAEDGRAVLALTKRGQLLSGACWQLSAAGVQWKTDAVVDEFSVLFQQQH